MTDTSSILSTTVIGSYPQPAWLVDHEILNAKIVPRIGTPEIWRVSKESLNEAQNDATLVAIRAQERAGIDTITDGEIRRESYSNHFTTSLGGLDGESPHVIDSQGFEIHVPRVVGPITRGGSVEVEYLKFLKNNTDRPVKVTLPGPFTLGKQAHDEYYRDEEILAMAFADVLNGEARELELAGADVIQFDDPWLRTDPDAANRYAIKAMNRAIQGLNATTAIHLCFGYGFVVSREKPKAYDFLEQLADCEIDQISIEAAQPGLDLGVLRSLSAKSIVLGVVDLSTNDVESPKLLAARIRSALPFISRERLIAAPDCGMKYIRRDAAFLKLAALAEAAAMVRTEFE